MKAVYAVVRFVKTNDCEAVPVSWLRVDGKRIVCAWPPFKMTARITEAISSSMNPAKDWQDYEAVVIKKFGNSLQICLFFLSDMLYYFFHL